MDYKRPVCTPTRSIIRSRLSSQGRDLFNRPVTRVDWNIKGNTSLSTYSPLLKTYTSVVTETYGAEIVYLLQRLATEGYAASTYLELSLRD